MIDLIMVIIAPRLKKGSKIGVLTVSNPLKEKHVEIINKGISRLEGMGFEVVKGKTIRVHDMITAGTPEERADDLMTMVKDKNISAIFFAWGGENASQILPLLDFKVIKENPKIFMGHSDPTIIMDPISDKTGLVTFYGHFASSFDPSWQYFSEYDLEMFNKVLINAEKSFTLPESGPRETYKSGKYEGKIMGGCITDLVKMLGTPYCPNFDSTILILEAYTIAPQQLLSHITHMKQNGVFDKIKGLLIGNIMLEESKNKVDLKELFNSELKEYNFPILKISDFGHNTHMAPIPIGGIISMDADKKEIIFKENYVL